MNVKNAKEHIEEITEIMAEIVAFDKNHKELSKETGFLVDAVAYLGDYRRTLNNAIENAEIKL